MKHIKLLAVLFLLPFSLYSQNESIKDSVQTYNLDPITITATRTEVARSLVAPSISVVSQDVLEANPQKICFFLFLVNRFQVSLSRREMFWDLT